MKKEISEYEYIKIDKGLQLKAGKGDVEKISVHRADNYAKNNEVSYTEVVTPILRTLKEALDSAEGRPKASKHDSDQMIHALMDLKASAATFHYPLISKLCKPLLLHIESYEFVSKESMRLLNLLYHLVTVVVQSEESEIGVKLGQELENTFLEACSVVSKRDSGLNT